MYGLSPAGTVIIFIIITFSLFQQSYWDAVSIQISERIGLFTPHLGLFTSSSWLSVSSWHVPSSPVSSLQGLSSWWSSSWQRVSSWQQVSSWQRVSSWQQVSSWQRQRVSSLQLAY